MKKRTIVFGYPAFVVWRSILAGFLFVIVLIGVLVGLVYMALSEMLNSINSSTQQGVSFYKYWMVVFGVFVVWWWLSRGSRRFARRLKKLNGRICLACSHEIDEGCQECARCGAQWSLDGLNKRWRKLASYPRGKNGDA